MFWIRGRYFEPTIISCENIMDMKNPLTQREVRESEPTRALGKDGSVSLQGGCKFCVYTRKPTL